MAIEDDVAEMSAGNIMIIWLAEMTAEMTADYSMIIWLVEMTAEMTACDFVRQQESRVQLLIKENQRLGKVHSKCLSQNNSGYRYNLL